MNFSNALPTPPPLPRIMFDDQLLADRHRQLAAHRQRLERAAELVALERDPGRQAAPLRKLDRLDDHLLLPALLGHAHHLVDVDDERGDGDRLAVDLEVSVAHELARLRDRAREAEPVDHVVEPALEQHQQVLARDPRHPLGVLEVAGELLLEHPVDALYLLLLAQPDREFGKARARLAVRAGRIVAPLDRALVGVAALALEEELQAFAPAEPAYRTQVSRHWCLRLRRLRPAAAWADGSRCAGLELRP